MSVLGVIQIRCKLETGLGGICLRFVTCAVKWTPVMEEIGEQLVPVNHPGRNKNSRQREYTQQTQIK